MNDQADCVMIKGRRYSVRSVNVTDSTNLSVQIPNNTNSWLVENYGTSIAFANGKPILPPPAPGLSGEAWGSEGNDGDIYAGELTIQFAAGGTNNVWVTFYIYLP